MIIDPRFPESWPIPATDYETKALAFCQNWQRGQLLFTLHTSGSTGTPKPISLTRDQMTASALLTARTLGLMPGDRALVCLNIHYVAGVMMLVRGMEVGMVMTIAEPSGNPLVDFSSTSSSFDFTALVPLQLQTILETTPDKVPILNRMKAILVGGAATSPGLEQLCQQIEAPVYATYGMTETVSHIALRRLNGSGKSAFFTALDGVELGVDERSCLHITSAATNFERVQTNDVVELLTGRQPFQFRLLGRADTIINSGGVKVQPEQIEQISLETLVALNPETTLPRFFVGGLPDPRLGQKIVLVIERQLISEDQFTSIQHNVREQLGNYAVPKEMIAVPTFIETPTGKIDRNATMTQIR